MPKLDVNAVEAYAKAYALQLCNEQFVQQERINGEALLRFSDVPQVNLFVVRDLYEVWKQTASAFRSPYFNFENEEVKTALQSFLNTVSKHISIERKDLEPLVAKATHETLELLLAPKEYYEGWLRDLPDFKLTEPDLKAAQKYNRIHKGILSGLSEKLGSESSVYVTQALKWLEELSETSLDATDDTLKLLSAKTPLDEASLYGKPVSEEPPTEQSFFDQFDTAPESKPAPVTAITEVPEPVVEEPVAEAPVSEPTPEPVVIPTPEETQPVLEAEPTVEESPVVETPAPQKPVSEPVSPTNFNDRLAQPTLGSTLAANKPTTSIHSLISLNHKFIFINQLFQGDSSAYHKAIEELDKVSSFDQAKDLMNRVYSSQYKWRNVADEADDFYEIVRKRFIG